MMLAKFFRYALSLSKTYHQKSVRISQASFVLYI